MNIANTVQIATKAVTAISSTTPVCGKFWLLYELPALFVTLFWLSVGVTVFLVVFVVVLAVVLAVFVVVFDVWFVGVNCNLFKSVNCY